MSKPVSDDDKNDSDVSFSTALTRWHEHRRTLDYRLQSAAWHDDDVFVRAASKDLIYDRLFDMQFDFAIIKHSLPHYIITDLFWQTQPVMRNARAPHVEFFCSLADTLLMLITQQTRERKQEP